MTPPTRGRTRPTARQEDGAKGSRAASSSRVQVAPPRYPAPARGRTKVAPAGPPHRGSHRSEVAVLPPWVAPWWPDLETVARSGWCGGAVWMAPVEHQLVGSGLLGEEEKEKGNGTAEVNTCVCSPVVRLSPASSLWVRGWRRATAAVYASGYEEIRPRGICVLLGQKTASRLPRQHVKWRGDGAVSVGKYLRLWDVFPQMFTFAVSPLSSLDCYTAFIPNPNPNLQLLLPAIISRKPEERANVNVSSLSNIFISAEPGATMPRWFITEAATNHMTSDKSIFSDLKPMAGLVIDDRAGAGAGLPMHGIGAVYSWEVALQDVWYVPGMSTYIGLVSAGQLTAIGLKTEIAGDVCTITSADGSEVGKGRMVPNYSSSSSAHTLFKLLNGELGSQPPETNGQLNLRTVYHLVLSCVLSSS
uniref:Extensin-like n=1 Tax=Oryza barthii TaxID=65489 RepID=A0A679BAU2_9ORYZ|nr:extensin-like [Oryza barthii]